MTGGRLRLAPPWLIALIAGAAMPCGSLAQAPSAGVAPSQRPGVTEHIVIYAVRVNHQSFGDAALLRESNGRLFVEKADLLAWRLRVPASAPHVFRGGEYFPIDGFEGADFTVDAPRQELRLEAPAEHFMQTVVDARPSAYAAPALPAPGAFANYDVLYSGSTGRQRIDALFEAGAFGAAGAAVNTFALQDVGRHTRVLRLDTTFTHDFPAQARTLTVGDSIGAAGLWGRAGRFAGVRYATNFATNPGFVTMPLPSLGGASALPTSMDLFVDGVLRQTTPLPPGPFRLDNVPVVNGRGEVQLVVRDLFGREQVISLPYYASSMLLRAGLVEESFEVGVERRNFGLRSNDYGRSIAVMQRRKGFSDTFTAEGRLEVLPHQVTAGVGASAAFNEVGVFTGGLAWSRQPDGNGALAVVAFERVIHGGIAFSGRSQWTTGKFTQLGLAQGAPAPRRLSSGTLGFSSAHYGAVGLGYALQDNRDRARNEFATASYSLTVAKSVALVATALKSLSGAKVQSFSASLSFAFGERSSASASVSDSSNTRQWTVQAQQSLPAGPGTGYRVLAATAPDANRLEVALSLQTERASYSAEAARVSNAYAYRASASGGIAFLDRRFFPSRRLSDGFGVAHIPGFPNVAMYVNNQMVGRTDAEGYAMLPALLAYQANAVRVEVDDLPFDAEIGAATLEAVPYSRSGLRLVFPIKRSGGALIIVVLEDGTPMPLGSTATIVGHDKQNVVAQRGELYVTGLAARNRLRITWRGQDCEVEVGVAPDAPPIPTIGPLVCRGVTR